MQSKVYFRVDANSEIGHGHMMRCMALAYVLKESFQVIFICKELPNYLAEELTDNCFFLERVLDYYAIPQMLSSNDVVVLDGYYFDTEYQKRIKALGCKLVCIDDLHEQEFLADLIINHAPGVLQSEYKAQEYTRFALGIKYSLLRPAFIKQAKIDRKPENIETVLICFGGADNKNLTQIILPIILKHTTFKKIIVVTGAAYAHLDSLEKLIQNCHQIEHNHAISENKMLSLMLQAELAIVPASGLLFESLAAGCRVITGYYINNQMEIYKGFKNLNAIIGTEEFQEIEIINALKTAAKFDPVKVIDGYSPDYLLEKINDLKNVYSDIS